MVGEAGSGWWALDLVVITYSASLKILYGSMPNGHSCDGYVTSANVEVLWALHAAGPHYRRERVQE